MLILRKSNQICRKISQTLICWWGAQMSRRDAFWQKKSIIQRQVFRQKAKSQGVNLICENFMRRFWLSQSFSLATSARLGKQTWMVGRGRDCQFVLWCSLMTSLPNEMIAEAESKSNKFVSPEHDVIRWVFRGREIKSHR